MEIVLRVLEAKVWTGSTQNWHSCRMCVCSLEIQVVFAVRVSELTTIAP